MQLWSKYQYQSRILSKGIFVAFFVLLLFSMNTQVFAESGNEIDISEYFEHEDFVSGTGEVIETSKLVFEIGKHNDVHVKHIVEGLKWGPDDPKLIKTLPGKHSNLQVTDEDGDYLRPIGFVGETFEKSEYVIVGQKPFGGFDLIVEYDLENFLELSEDGIWTKEFIFPYDVMIYFDEEIELIFANSRPVDISTAKGINCLGCSIAIEFFDNSDPIIKKIINSENKFEEISNSGQEYTVEFLTDGEIGDLNFIEELDYLAFSVSKENQIVSVKIPSELLLSPYSVYLTENDQDILAETDKIRKTEYGHTDTFSNVSFKTQKEGIIHVVGATEEEHEKMLQRLESRNTQIENESSQISNQNEREVVEDPRVELYETWGENNVEENNNNTIIFIIIGIIVAAIIAFVVKLKRN